MTRLRLSTIIPCRNEAAHIEQLLESLAGQDFKDHEIVIVDGQSTDSTSTLVDHYLTTHPGLPIKLIKNSRGTISAGLNLGIRQATGEIIVRLDGHSHPPADYLSRCVEVLETSGATMVGGAWSIQPGAPDVVAHAIACAVSSRLGAGDALYRLGSTHLAQEVDTVPFGCFHRRTWEKLGGYDETLLSNEDYEFNLRVRRSGGRVYFDPRIRCDYFARTSLIALARQYSRYGWWKAQVLKRYPGSLRLRQALPLLWSGSGLILGGAAVLTPPIRLGVLLLWTAYLAVLILGAGSLTWQRRKGADFWLALMLAYLVIHFSWGLGAWGGILWGNLVRAEKVILDP